MTAIDELREVSGLSWEQLARLVGVSRGALAMWSRGGAMNPWHTERVAELAAVVAALPGQSPTERQRELFRPRRGLRSMYDELLAGTGAPV